MRKTFTLEFSVDSTLPDMALADALQAALTWSSRDIEGVANFRLVDLVVQPFDGLRREDVIELLESMGSEHLDPVTNKFVLSAILFKAEQ